MHVHHVHGLRCVLVEYQLGRQQYFYLYACPCGEEMEVEVSEAIASLMQPDLAWWYGQGVWQMEPWEEEE